MIAKKTIFHFLLIIWPSTIATTYEFEKRAQKINLSTSINIPCHHKHAPYLLNLLTCLEKQSILPDEIVISLSGTRNLSSEVILNLIDHEGPCPITLILSKSPKNEAENRNIACRNSQNDLIICQDADDLPHPQRIECIKYFFENYSIIHLLHGYGYDQENSKYQSFMDFQYYTDFESIKKIHIDSIDTIFDLGIYVANGPASFLRNIFEKVQWDKRCGAGVDIKFNNAVYALSHETMIIPENLYIYRTNLSSYEATPAEPSSTSKTSCIYLD